jgi:hypothetical protein
MGRWVIEIRETRDLLVAPTPQHPRALRLESSAHLEVLESTACTVGSLGL